MPTTNTQRKRRAAALEDMAYRFVPGDRPVVFEDPRPSVLFQVERGALSPSLIATLTESTEELIAALFGARLARLAAYYAAHLPEDEARRVAPLRTFSTLAINASAQFAPHRDRLDCHFGLAVIVPFGTWTGGDLLVDELRLRCEVRPGDAVFMQTANLTHSNSEVVGRRRSLSFFYDNNVFAAAEPG